MVENYKDLKCQKVYSELLISEGYTWDLMPLAYRLNLMVL